MDEEVVSKIISGVRVQFPYQPYPNQLILMNKLLNALNNHQNALLESPTGTGQFLLSKFSLLIPARKNFGLVVCCPCMARKAIN